MKADPSRETFRWRKVFKPKMKQDAGENRDFELDMVEGTRQDGHRVKVKSSIQNR